MMLAEIDWANVAVAFLTALGVAGGGAAFVIRVSRQRDKSITQLETWRQIQTEACKQTHERLNGTVEKIFEKVDEIADAQSEANGELKVIRSILDKKDVLPT